MRVLIVNDDTVNDMYNRSLTQALNLIRDYNTTDSGTQIIFDPYGKKEESTMGESDKVFFFTRTEFFNGIMNQASTIKDLHMNSNGFPQIEVQEEIFMNPYFLPFLSQETLFAYMPQIPWDDFGNHIRLEDNDAELFMELWNKFLQQNKDVLNAVYRAEYPLDEGTSTIGYIFMNKEIE